MSRSISGVHLLVHSLAAWSASQEPPAALHAQQESMPDFGLKIEELLQYAASPRCPLQITKVKRSHPQVIGHEDLDRAGLVRRHADPAVDVAGIEGKQGVGGLLLLGGRKVSVRALEVARHEIEEAVCLDHPTSELHQVREFVVAGEIPAFGTQRTLITDPAREPSQGAIRRLLERL